MMDVPQDKMFKILKLSIVTVNRKANLVQKLLPEDSERVVGMVNLIGHLAHLLFVAILGLFAFASE